MILYTLNLNSNNFLQFIALNRKKRKTVHVNLESTILTTLQQYLYWRVWKVRKGYKKEFKNSWIFKNLFKERAIVKWGGEKAEAAQLGIEIERGRQLGNGKKMKGKEKAPGNGAYWAVVCSTVGVCVCVLYIINK